MPLTGGKLATDIKHLWSRRVSAPDPVQNTYDHKMLKYKLLLLQIQKLCVLDTWHHVASGSRSLLSGAGMTLTDFNRPHAK